MAINEELTTLKEDFLSRLPGSELITCHPSMVLARISRTAFKEVRVAIQFPADYPDNPLLVELKSKTLSARILDSLTKLCDEELKKWKGKQQIMSLLVFVKHFLDENPFIACSDEIMYIKKELVSEHDDLKLKQKAGIVSMTIRQQRYFLSVKLSVPDAYPTDAVSIEITECNVPPDLLLTFAGQSQELARRCVTPPLKPKPKDPPFEPSPSLQRVACLLANDCLRHCVAQKCSLCKKPALPDNPKEVVVDLNADMHVERIYCGHLFHFKCLDTYVKTPPFKGGKMCPVSGCGKRIYHDKWVTTKNTKLAEDRWAHEEARKRELSEVVDFLGL